jgi:ABC-2 type transport system permease protein
MRASHIGARLPSARRVGAITRNELRVLRRDPAPLAVLLVLPLLLITLLRPAYGAVEQLSHARYPNGAEQAVPGMAVTFAFNLVGAVGFGFLRDHSWRTWDRLRASVTGAELLLGKLCPALVQAAVQFLLLFGLGLLVFGLNVHGSLAQLAIVWAAFSSCLVAIGLVLAAFCHTTGQVYATTNIVGLVLAGAGGAIVPYPILPASVRAVATVDPARWAMRGYQEIIVGHGNWVGVLSSACALAGLAVLLLLLAATRFRFDDAKVSWA